MLRIIVAAFSLFFLKRKETEGRRQRAHLLEGGREGAPARCACEADCSIKRTRSVLGKTIIAFVARSRDNIIMVVEPTKTNTNEVLGVGECFIEIKELRKLEGNDFIRKNIRIMGGYPMATVADANMNIRIQKKIDEIAETERSDDDWNPEDFD